MTILLRSITRPPTSLAIRIQQIRAYSSAPSSLVTTEIFPAPHCGCIKVLSLNRPEARNAISRKLLSDLRAELSSLSLFNPSQGQPANPDSVRALIIASNVPGVFCAGADLKERISFSLEE
jgi:methylglutaconyl-CoA hydratase